jgi:hypothetical protein
MTVIHKLARKDRTIDGTGISYRSLCGLLVRRRSRNFSYDWEIVTCDRCRKIKEDPTLKTVRGDLDN